MKFTRNGLDTYHNYLLGDYRMVTFQRGLLKYSDSVCGLLNRRHRLEAWSCEKFQKGQHLMTAIFGKTTEALNLGICTAQTVTVGSSRLLGNGASRKRHSTTNYSLSHCTNVLKENKVFSFFHFVSFTDVINWNNWNH